MSTSYAALFRHFGIDPHNEELYALAFTHPSCNSELGTKHQDYERLEFLGDSIVGMVVSELAYKWHPEMDEGGLTQLKNQHVQSEYEAKMCIRLGLVPYIRLGSSISMRLVEEEEAVLSKAERALYENVFEAFIGALFLDQGYLFVHRLLEDLYTESIRAGEIRLDPKSALQQLLQADGAVNISYRVLAKTGDAQNPHVTAAVFFDGMELGRGEGHNTKEAEAKAASAALKKLSLPKEGQ